MYYDFQLQKTCELLPMLYGKRSFCKPIL